jgi:peptide chain release factor 2
MLEFEEYRQKLLALGPQIADLAEALRLKYAKERIAEIQKESEDPDFWKDIEKSQKLNKELKNLKQKCRKHEKLENSLNDFLALCEMALEEEDSSMLGELKEGYEELEEELESARLDALLTGEYDSNNAIMTLHAGAGGTEAQDWTSMLYRMYTRWAERQGYSYTVLDLLDGEEARYKVGDVKNRGHECLRLPKK